MPEIVTEQGKNLTFIILHFGIDQVIEKLSHRRIWTLVYELVDAIEIEEPKLLIFGEKAEKNNNCFKGFDY